MEYSYIVREYGKAETELPASCETYTNGSHDLLLYATQQTAETPDGNFPDNDSRRYRLLK